MDLRVFETVKEFEVICNNAHGAEITSAYTSDLLSDVLANAEEDSVLITIQAHKNSIAVCSIAGCNAVIFCNDRAVDAATIEAAEEAEVALFQTSLNQFEASLVVGELLKNNE